MASPISEVETARPPPGPIRSAVRSPSASTRSTAASSRSASAPDIAGQGKANPIACILSFAMALRYSFDAGEQAARLEAAVEKVLADGVRTPDLVGPDGGAAATTAEMGDAIVAALDA